MNNKLLAYIAIPPELLVSLSELKTHFLGRIHEFFSSDVHLSGVSDSFKLAALYVILDHSKSKKIEKYLKKLSLPKMGAVIHACKHGT